jgi:hypothetical protein
MADGAMLNIPNWTLRYLYQMVLLQKSHKERYRWQKIALGIWSSIDGKDKVHVKHNVMD